MSDVELRDELMTLLTAGHETTATSLAWAVERLVRHPGGLERLAGDPALRRRGRQGDPAPAPGRRARPAQAARAARGRRPRAAGRARRWRRSSSSCTAARTSTPSPTPSGPSASSAQPPGTYSWIPFGGGVRRCLGAAFAQVEMQTSCCRRWPSRSRWRPSGGAESRAPARHHPRPGARRAGARARGALACPPPRARPLPAARPAARACRRSRSTASARCPTSPRRTTGSAATSSSTSGSPARVGGRARRRPRVRRGLRLRRARRARAYSVVGVDANPDAHEHARLRYRAPNLRFVRDMVETYSEPCDAVVFLQTIEHVHDPDGGARERARACSRPGGMAFVSTPNVLTLAPPGRRALGQPVARARVPRRGVPRAVRRALRLASSSTASSTRARCARTSSRCAPAGIASTPRCG